MWISLPSRKSFIDILTIQTKTLIEGKKLQLLIIAATSITEILDGKNELNNSTENDLLVVEE